MAAAALFLFLTAPLYIKSDRPNFLCLACHESRGPYLSWKTSTHKKNTCASCHAAIGAWRMIWGHVAGSSVTPEKRSISSFEKCVGCHSKISGTVYFHSIKFPHDSHRKYIQDCRVCHGNVVHGSRIEYRRPPKKETCYTCHDNKQASRKCDVCHQKFTKELPQQLDPKWISSHKADLARFKTACVKCHDKKFCVECHRRVNPHSDGWLKKKHRSAARKNTRKCQICHTSKDCTKCHEVLQQHRSDWYDGHRRLALASKESCAKCHDDNFCAACHKGITTHPLNWLVLHRSDPESKNNRQTCTQCHTEHYCESCHGGKPTLHHKGNWLSNHGPALSARGEGDTDIEACISCHVPDFCLACHNGVRKNVHSRNFTAMHRKVSPKSMPRCKMCHTVESCNKCHKSSLPSDHKDASWKQTHGISAIRNMDSCTLCHEKPFCEACHSRKVPVSHESADRWLKNHGAGSRGNDSRCGLCHDNAFCNACHKRARPPDHYADTWPQTHGRTAISDMNNCSACHDNEDCKQCHAEQKSHQIPGWMKDHDVSRLDQSFDQCSKCHSLGTCIGCHEKSGVKGHGVCTGCHSFMSNPQKLKDNPCAACHEKLSGTNDHKKHEPVGCVECHKPHNMKVTVPTACVSCHDKGKDHTMDMSCFECHSFK